eukprot:scaffold8850_cov72-Phaeocystis_antarctica.AAC.12
MEEAAARRRPHCHSPQSARPGGTRGGRRGTLPHRGQAQRLEPARRGARHAIDVRKRRACTVVAARLKAKRRALVAIPTRLAARRARRHRRDRVTRADGRVHEGDCRVEAFEEGRSVIDGAAQVARVLRPAVGEESSSFEEAIGIVDLARRRPPTCHRLQLRDVLRVDRPTNESAWVAGVRNKWARTRALALARVEAIARRARPHRCVARRPGARGLVTALMEDVLCEPRHGAPRRVAGPDGGTACGRRVGEQVIGRKVGARRDAANGHTLRVDRESGKPRLLVVGHRE